MKEALFVTIPLAYLTALIWLAYHHPKGSLELIKSIFRVVWVVSTGWAIFVMGVDFEYEKILKIHKDIPNYKSEWYLNIWTPNTILIVNTALYVGFIYLSEYFDNLRSGKYGDKPNH